MNILAWVIGVAVIVLLLAVFLWRPAGRRQAARKLHKAAPKLPAEEFAEEITGDMVPAVAAKPPRHPEIPWHYGVNRLVLMVRDPNWLFAYWEITAAKQEEFNRQHGTTAWKESRPVLRVYDVTGVDFNGNNANRYMDFAISDYVDNWHIEVSRPNAAFCVDLGRVFPDGKFVTLLRSNVVQTPSVAVSDLVDEEWMWIEGIYRTITRLHPGSSPQVIEDVAQRMGLAPLGISSPEFSGHRK